MKSWAEKSGADRGSSAHLRVGGGRVSAEDHVGSGTTETGLRTTRMKKMMFLPWLHVRKKALEKDTALSRVRSYKSLLNV